MADSKAYNLVWGYHVNAGLKDYAKQLEKQARQRGIILFEYNVPGEDLKRREKNLQEIQSQKLLEDSKAKPEIILPTSKSKKN